MSSQHRHNPIPFRPTARNRAWLLEEAGETRRPVNAILNEAVTGHRRALRERRDQERKTMARTVREPEIIRAKWIMDDAATLPEAAAKVRAFADELDRMHAEGWRLEQPVQDDYGFVVRPKEKPATEG
jgi:hypothetical protein